MTLRRLNIIRIVTRGLFVCASLYSLQIFAQAAGPSQLNITGMLVDSSGIAISNANVKFKIEIWDKDATCLLYSEQHLGQDLATTSGAFSLPIGSGSSIVNNLESSTSFDAKIFQNPGSVSAFPGCGGLTLASGDNRLIRVYYDIGGGFVTMTPDLPVTSAPYAMVAESLQGKAPTDFIQVHNDATNELTQANAEYVFSVAKYPNLKALVDGSSSQYIGAIPTASVGFNSQRLISVADPTAAQDAVTKHYDDGNLGGKALDVTGVGTGLGNGKTLVWDATLSKWSTAAAGSVSSIIAGTGLTGGTITTTGTIAVDVGVAAGEIVQLNGSAQLPAVDGSLLTAVNATKLQSYGVAATAPTVNGQVLTWNTTSSLWEPKAPTGGITALTGEVTASGSGSVVATIANDKITSNKINSTGVFPNRLLITDATTGASVGYASCTIAGQVMAWTTSGWACGDASSVVTGGGGWVNGGNTVGANSTLGNKDSYSLDLITNNLPRMTIDNAGNVGIGTASPGAAIDVQSTLTGSSGTVYGAKIGPTINTTGTTNYTALYVNVTETAVTGTKLLMDLQNGGTSEFSVDHFGNVSTLGSFTSSNTIGTSQSNGTLYATPGSIAVPVGSVVSATNKSGTDSTGAFHTMIVKNSNNVVQNAYIGAISTTGAGVYTPSIVLGGQTASAAYTERMRIDSNGNVGIGTTAPGSLLTVNGGAIVSTPPSTGATQCMDFTTGNILISSYSGTNAIKIGGLADGGAYTVILTGYTAGQTVTVTAYTDSACAAAITTGVDFGGSTTAITNTFTAVGNTQVLTFIYSGTQGVAYASASGNFFK